MNKILNAKFSSNNIQRILNISSVTKSFHLSRYSLMPLNSIIYRNYQTYKKRQLAVSTTTCDMLGKQSLRME